jgi:2-oxoglutarate ferredoxin oxidoreductase subunit alpha
MPVNDLTLLIGGDAGQGIESSGAGFCTVLARSGLHIFSVPDNRSRIRGGHNFYLIKTSAQPITSWTEPIQLVVALTPETIEIHRHKLVPGGAIIYDADFPVDSNSLLQSQIKPIPIPLTQITQQAGGSKVMANTAMLGAVAGLTQFPLDLVTAVIHDNFKKKGEATVTLNRNIAKAAYDYVVAQFGISFNWQLRPVAAPQRMVINGNQALSLGALLGGCNFVTAYPMTPGTSIFLWLTAHADRYGIVSKQAEDEIAAFCMAIGAAHVGARALVPTSGGGFALMVEALSLAGITETPLVIVEAQRPGPSTGLATRTEQPDLLFTLFASHGEFPRIVLAPGTVTQCFEAGWRAFNLAEKYQTPVIILTDAFLASSQRTIERAALDFSTVKIDRGQLLSDRELDQFTAEYNRFAFTENGISPRALPGHPQAIYSSPSNEHNESGALSEDVTNRIQMQQKRMRKMETALSEMNPPLLYGPAQAETTLVCWGSTLAPLLAAVETLNQDKPNTANILQLVDLWPFPTAKVTPFLEHARRLIAVEGNSTGQCANLLRMITGFEVTGKILKYDGRPFSPEYILTHFKEMDACQQ